MKERKIWIDATKGFGIILVMISHFFFIPKEYQCFVAGYMPMFFILSGYTIKFSDNFMK